MRRRLIAFLCCSTVSNLTIAGARADEDTWRLHSAQFSALREKHAFADAEKVGLAAIQEAKNAGREADLATSWNNLGALYYDMGRYYYWVIK